MAKNFGGPFDIKQQSGSGGGGGTVTQVDTSGSVTGGPITATGTVQLVNDNATPGNSKYYGTDSGGTKGFFDVPAGAVESVTGTDPITVDNTDPDNPVVGVETIIEDTYANISTLISGNDLLPGWTYKITDRADLGIVLQAVENNELSLQGSGGFFNADFQDEGNYSGVPSVGTRRGIWTAANESGVPYVNNDIVIWNLRHYEVTDDTQFDGTNPATNTAAYTILAKAANLGYIEEWDAIEFDFANDYIQLRHDIRGNQISCSYAQAQTFTVNPLDVFQWGRTGTNSNFVNESLLSCMNSTALAVSGNTLLMASKILANQFGLTSPSSFISDNFLRNGSTIDGTQGGGSLTANSLNFQCTINAPLMDSAGVSYNEMFDNCTIDAELSGFQGLIYRNKLHSSCNIIASQLSSSGTVSDNDLFWECEIDATAGGANHDQNVLKMGASIDASASNVGVSVNNNNIFNGTLSVANADGNITNNTIIDGTMDGTNAVDDMTNNHVENGDLNVSSYNGTVNNNRVINGTISASTLVGSALDNNEVYDEAVFNLTGSEIDSVTGNIIYGTLNASSAVGADTVSENFVDTTSSMLISGLNASSAIGNKVRGNSNLTVAGSTGLIGANVLESASVLEVSISNDSEISFNYFFNSQLSTTANTGRMRGNNINNTTIAFDGNTGVFSRNTITDSALDMASIVNNGDITDNEFNSTNLFFGLAGGSITNCYIDLTDTIILPDGIYNSLKAMVGVSSNFEFEYDITGLSTLDMSTPGPLYGIIKMVSENSSEAITSISNMGTYFPIRFYPGDGLAVTWTHTPIITPPVAGDLVLDGDTTIVTVGRSTVSDFIDLQNWLASGIIRQTGDSII